MKIFYSWSGKMSKEIAGEFRDFLPLLIPSIIPFYTPKDIDKGTQWLNEIITGLNECIAGIVFVTRENFDTPWIMFEAGAIANRNMGALVYPVFFNISTADVNNPLTKIFQATNFNKEDIWHMLSNMNNKLESGKVSDINLRKHFDNYFPEFEAKVNAIIAKYSDVKKPENNNSNVPNRNDSDKMDEMLSIMRDIQLKQNRPRSNSFNSMIDRPWESRGPIMTDPGPPDKWIDGTQMAKKLIDRMQSEAMSVKPSEIAPDGFNFAS